MNKLFAIMNDPFESTDPQNVRIIPTVEVEPKAHPKHRPKPEWVLVYKNSQGELSRVPGRVSSYLEFKATKPDPVHPNTNWSWFHFKNAKGAFIATPGNYFLCAKIQGKYLIRHDSLFEDYRRDWKVIDQMSYRNIHSDTSDVLRNQISQDEWRTYDDDEVISHRQPQNAQSEHLLPISSTDDSSPSPAPPIDRPISPNLPAQHPKLNRKNLAERLQLPGT